MSHVTNPETTARQTDPTLANCGFYVKTITFDDNWQTTDTAWRTIHKNSTTPKNGIMPSLITLPSGAAVENSVQLYVWSDNDDVIRVVGGEEKTLSTDNAGGTLYTYVGTVTLQGGATSANFTLQARGEEGESANIILSSTPYYTISSSTGAAIVDYLTVPVTVGEALPPTLTVNATATDVTADENWTTWKASLVVDATTPYTDDVTITITPDVLGIPDENVSDYVCLSKSASVTDISSLGSTIDVTH